MKPFCIYILLICLACSASAQDLNARVTVLAPKLQNVSKRVFDDLATAMKDFLNGRKWCADPIEPQERFECSFVFTATSYDGAGNWGGELQVQSSRPVYNSSYTTTLLNVNDKDVQFTYNDGEPIDYTDQSYTGNLSSIMAFYAYIIIGLDYDSFSRFGGSYYFNLAQNVVNLAQTSSYKGWKAFDNNNVSRYWLSENLNDKAYAPLRSFIYDYHRNGLDVMADNSGKGLKEIIGLLPVLGQLDRTRLGAMLPLVFYSAKSDELTAILSKADQQDKTQAMNLLLQADPGDGNKYQTLQGK
jgi:hypothetical protein